MRTKELQEAPAAVGYAGGGIDGVYVGGRPSARFMASAIRPAHNNTARVPTARRRWRFGLLQGPVTEVNGEMDEGLAGCIAERCWRREIPVSSRVGPIRRRRMRD